MSIPFPHPGYSENSPKRVRVLFNKTWLVDSKKAKLVWEHPFYPVFYFPKSEVSDKYLQPASGEPANDSKAATYDIVVDKKHAEAAAIVHKAGDHKDYVKIVLGKMDAWFEEEEQIFVHPKDPYKRVDVLQSARHIRIEVDGVEVGNSTKPRFLYETGLPMRTYIPKTDARMDLFETSDLATGCPYKGVASYYNVTLPSDEKKDNIVWWYRSPNIEVAQITGFVAFYDEKVDVWIDGVKVDRPKS